MRKTNHARILLKADAGWADQAIAEALDVSIPTIQRIHQRFMEQNFEQFLTPSRSRRRYQRLLDDVQEVYLIAMACITPPKGYDRWSLRLLAEKIVQIVREPRTCPMTGGGFYLIRKESNEERSRPERQ